MSIIALYWQYISTRITRSIMLSVSEILPVILIVWRPLKIDYIPKIRDLTWRRKIDVNRKKKRTIKILCWYREKTVASSHSAFFHLVYALNKCLYVFRICKWINFCIPFIRTIRCFTDSAQYLLCSSLQMYKCLQASTRLEIGRQK